MKLPFMYNYNRHNEFNVNLGLVRVKGMVSLVIEASMRLPCLKQPRVGELCILSIPEESDEKNIVFFATKYFSTCPREK